MFLWALPLVAAAQSAGEDTEKEPVFIPPKAGVPSDRLSAGTRDIEAAKNDLVYLLIPPGGGLTSLANPPLIWRVVSGFRGSMQAQIAPLSGPSVGFRREGAFLPGYYALDLARSSMELEIGQIYRIEITLFDQDTPIARVSGLVERVQPSQGAPGAQGVWFDALAPLVSVGLSGFVRVTDPQKLDILLNAGGVSQ